MGGSGMNEVVKYNNYMNELSFKDFSDYDLNFLMVICAKMKDLGEETQHFEYRKLMELLDWDMSKSIDVFHKDLKRMSEKLRHVGATIDIDPDVFTAFNLFSDFEGNKKKRELIVRLNPRFKYILNDLTRNFTRFELAEYVHLDGKYSKLLYQHLKQYRKAGWWQTSVDDLRRELSIPDSMPTRNIIPKVLNTSVELIKTCKGFSELHVEVIRSSRRGRAVIGYKFTWTADKQIPGQMSLDDFKKTPPKKKKVSKKKADFEQNTYDYEKLEKELLKN
jgi:plasmid replication initiation protein